MEKDTRKRKEDSLEEDPHPVRAQVSETAVVVTARMINSELTCPICLGIIRNCTTVMECLHRFCLACIEKSLRLGRKQCPSCRVACPSRRNLRQDTNFDALVAKIYPDIRKAEATLQRMTLSVINAQNHGAFAKAMEDGMLKQKEKSKRGYVEASPQPLRSSVSSPAESGESRKRNGSSSSSSSNSNSNNSSSSSNSNGSSSSEVNPAEESLPLSALSKDIQVRSSISLILRKRADSLEVATLTKCCIRTSRLLTIEQLQRYLSLKLESKNTLVVSLTDGLTGNNNNNNSSDNNNNNENNNNNNNKLEANLTLGAVEGTLWKQPAPMVLFYACV